MKKSILIPFTLAVSFASTTFAADKNHTSSSTHKGPDDPNNLSTAYSNCASETKHSPIKFNYQAVGHKVVSNGHSVQIIFNAGSSISLSEHEYGLKQFHFHAPRENLIAGKSHPLEAHLVHADMQGNLVVVILMIEQGPDNKQLKEAWNNIEANKATKTQHTLVNAASLLPGNQDYYRINGSLTTPSCSEGISWLVMKQAIRASEDQIKKFSQVMHHPDSRPVRILRTRTIPGNP